MPGGNFIDHVKLCTRSGKGGAGAVHFRREKHVPKGGPDGGNGGRGGHIILHGNRQLWTLLHLRYRKHVIAKNGQNGEGGMRSGAQGEDVILEVPLGTVAWDSETGDQLAEITKDQEEMVIAQGGRGGLGNENFKTATRQTPRFAQEGESGEERWVILELKVLADVGLVGQPNAGKSTLLSVVSEAKPEIADYPFTTLVPNLGVVSYRDHKSFIVADIPGLIKGAAEGKGLGTRFLRHIERNSVLLFMVPSDADNITGDYHLLVDELKKYNPELLDKERLLAVTKADLLDEELKEEIRQTLPQSVETVMISSITGEGIAVLKDLLWRLLSRE